MEAAGIVAVNVRMYVIIQLYNYIIITGGGDGGGGHRGG